MTISNYADLDGSRLAGQNTSGRPSFQLVNGVQRPVVHLKYTNWNSFHGYPPISGGGRPSLSGSSTSAPSFGSGVNPREKDPGYYCGFRYHLMATTTMIASVSLLVCFILLAVIWPISQGEWHPASVIFLVALAGGNFLVLLGERKRLPGLFLPFLLLNLISIILMVAKFLVPLVLVLVQLPGFHKLILLLQKYEKFDQDLIWTSLAVTGFQLLFLFTTTVLLGWGELVVYRTFRYLLRERTLALETKSLSNTSAIDDPSYRYSCFSTDSSSVAGGKRYGRALTITKF